ncbi:ribonuclease 2-like [Magnolia sinica]|uniref:ribonuclease 2-like n=1 Tax=Magnolia sinica TaxID=86752 RepID=UPI002658A8A3|nr:ribonuclease 2-like [Magnolia sinica]
MTSPLAARSFLSLLLPLFFSFLCFSTSEVFGEEQREFDYFLLALQWPGTYCQRTHHCCPKNGCCQSSLPRTEFTIHGLWVDYNDGSWPSCCSRSDFDIKKITSLMGMLEKYWPSLSCSSSSLCHGGKGLFWAHEWEKHGTCSFPVIQDEYSYFSTALNLYVKYNMTRILTDAGYLPNNANKYPLGDIVATIKDTFGASPSLTCKHGAVEELHICFYKDFKPRDCTIGSSTQDDMLGSRSSCPRYISLPEYSPPMLQDGNAAIPWLPEIDVL